MKFGRTAIDGVLIVDVTTRTDERGFFARTFCEDEFAKQGLQARFEQSSVSHNLTKGTLRGMHYQELPNAEIKFVRCIRGAIFDVAIDLRPGSLTQGRWVSAVLTADNARALYIGAGFAHGYQTLADNTDVLYQITPAYQPGHERGVRWDDPAFSVCWPEETVKLSQRDGSYPDWIG